MTNEQKNIHCLPLSQGSCRQPWGRDLLRVTGDQGLFSLPSMIVLIAYGHACAIKK